MRVATWNVNSLRARLPQVLDWLVRHQPDLLAVQEIKITDEQCPVDELRAIGYHAAISGQKGYNGVAIFSRKPASGECIRDIPGFEDSARRVIACSFGPLRLINLYVPNGGQITGTDSFLYKLEWLAHLKIWLGEELARHPYLAAVGDFNIAPEPSDVHAPELWAGRVMFSPPEHAALRELLAVGLVDTFRLFEQAPATFSWWDYQMGAFRRNRGLRIDLILASRPLAERCTACYVDKEPRRLTRPSDHTPVVAEFSLPRRAE